MKSRARATCRPDLIFIIILLGSIFVGCKKGEGSNGFFKTPFQDESQFIVENIITDVAEMLYFAGHHDLPKPVTVDAQEVAGAPGVPAYNIKVRVGHSTIVESKVTISGPIWSETNYADITKELAAALKVISPSSAPGEDVSMLDSLTDGEAGTLAQQDVIVSSDLQSQFANPGKHEEAAALLGAFALRERAGHFSDIRLALCRMTAHLALARFFSGDNPFDVVGQIAECMLATHMNNEVNAVAQIEQLDTSQKPVATWARTLRAYNTYDFRPLTASTNIPGIEQIAWFYAYAYANRGTVAWNRVGNAVASRPDFCRIVAALGYDVGMANVMDRVWFPLEYREIRESYKMLQGHELQKGDFVAALNAEPDRCFVINPNGKPRVRIIGWGLWAMQLQHHLCHAVTTEYHTYNEQYGLSDQAWQFAQASEKQFGQLRYYGFVRRLDCTNEASYRSSTDQGWAFAFEHPHLTPLAWMDYLCGSVPYAPRYLPFPNPHCNEWTVHDPLPGTVYDADIRLDFPSFSDNPQNVVKAHEMAPYDIGICHHMAGSFGSDWTEKRAMAVLGKLYPYCGVAEYWIANTQRDDPEKYIKTMHLAASWDPSYYYNLAQYELSKGKTNEAMETYDEEEKVDADVVKMSNLALDRVKYYLAHGQQPKAKRIADAAADTYSWGGLAAEADYCEETGDLRQAFDCYSKIAERYDSYGGSGPLTLFCFRHQTPTGDATLDKEIAERVQSLNKQTEKVTLSSFSGAPADGVYLKTTTPALQSISLIPGCIIVALRGFRVHNDDQATVVRDRDPAPDMEIIFWDGSRYREATTTLNEEHRLGVDWQTYSAKSN